MPATRSMPSSRRGHPFAGLLDPAGLQILPQELQVVGHAGQGIVDFMGRAGGESTEARQPFRVLDLHFEGPQPFLLSALAFEARQPSSPAHGERAEQQGDRQQRHVQDQGSAIEPGQPIHGTEHPGIAFRTFQPALERRLPAIARHRLQGALGIGGQRPVQLEGGAQIRDQGAGIEPGFELARSVEGPSGAQQPQIQGKGGAGCRQGGHLAVPLGDRQHLITVAYSEACHRRVGTQIEQQGRFQLQPCPAARHRIHLVVGRQGAERSRPSEEVETVVLAGQSRLQGAGIGTDLQLETLLNRPTRVSPSRHQADHRPQIDRYQEGDQQHARVQPVTGEAHG